MRNKRLYVTDVPRTVWWPQLVIRVGEPASRDLDDRWVVKHPSATDTGTQFSACPCPFVYHTYSGRPVRGAHWDNTSGHFELSTHTKQSSSLLLAAAKRWMNKKNKKKTLYWLHLSDTILSKPMMVEDELGHMRPLLPCDLNGTVWLHCALKQIFNDCLLPLY